MSARTYVIGVGMTKFDKPGTKAGDYPDWAKEAGEKALADAGIPYEDVEQAYAGYCYGDSTYGQRALYGLGLTGIPIVNVNNNCSTGSSALFLARQAVRGGIVDCALAIGFEKMEKGSLGVKYTDRTNAIDKHAMAMFALREPEESPPAPQMFGNAGRDHMEKYGSEPDHYAWIGWKNHKHSVNNPYAQFQDEYTLEEIKGSRVIHEPLTKLQCSPTSDGAACAIVAWATESGVVRRCPLQPRAVQVEGSAAAARRSGVADGELMDLAGGQPPGDRLAVGRSDQAGLLGGLDKGSSEVTTEEVAGLGGARNAGGVLIDVPSPLAGGGEARGTPSQQGDRSADVRVLRGADRQVGVGVVVERANGHRVTERVLGAGDSGHAGGILGPELGTGAGESGGRPADQGDPAGAEELVALQAVPVGYAHSEVVPSVCVHVAGRQGAAEPILTGDRFRYADVGAGERIGLAGSDAGRAEFEGLHRPAAVTGRRDGQLGPPIPAEVSGDQPSAEEGDLCWRPRNIGGRSGDLNHRPAGPIQPILAAVQDGYATGRRRARHVESAGCDGQIVGAVIVQVADRQRRAEGRPIGIRTEEHAREALDARGGETGGRSIEHVDRTDVVLAR